MEIIFLKFSNEKRNSKGYFWYFTPFIQTIPFKDIFFIFIIYFHYLFKFFSPKVAIKHLKIATNIYVKSRMHDDVSCSAGANDYGFKTSSTSKQEFLANFQKKKRSWKNPQILGKPYEI